ncbi:MAG: glycosyltransferase, partial [Brachybacterium sp.]|nr:glycosyltransferase [Brachybacterium sp.]
TEHLPVELLGRREDVPVLLERADLVVSAAVWEGQPVWLQEALRAGRAIVATDAGGTRWVTGEAAQLVPVGDPAALADAITAHHGLERRRRGEERSRRRAEELPTAGDMVRQLTDILVPARGRW